jgi:hypothetical protein
MLDDRDRASPKRRRLLRRLMALTAASGLLFPSPVQAQEGPVSLGGGVFVGYAFGAKPGVEWGFEAFATYLYGGVGCSDAQRYGLGPLVQVAVIGTDDPRITLAVQGGGEVARPPQGLNTAFSGELGATYRFGDTPGFGIHTGLALEVFLVNAALRRQWLLDENAITGGVRILPTYGSPGSCIVGRPLRTQTGVARVGDRARSVGANFSANEKAGPREHAGRAWERDAQYECASVPAFLQLAADLLAHGAPDSLVERALSAAEDEIAHAALCADMASQYLGHRVWPTLPDSLGQAPQRGVSSLTRLAVESWLDGCVAEGAAAARAARAARRASEPVARAAQVRIACDEARHADLGWSILQWTVDRGGSHVRDAIRAHGDTEVASAEDIGGLERYGRLGAAEMNAVADRHVERSRRRLARFLDPQP